MALRLIFCNSVLYFLYFVSTHNLVSTGNPFFVSIPLYSCFSFLILFSIPGISQASLQSLPYGIVFDLIGMKCSIRLLRSDANLLLIISIFALFDHNYSQSMLDNALFNLSRCSRSLLWILMGSFSLCFIPAILRRQGR